MSKASSRFGADFQWKFKGLYVQCSQLNFYTTWNVGPPLGFRNKRNTRNLQHEYCVLGQLLNSSHRSLWSMLNSTTHYHYEDNNVTEQAGIWKGELGFLHENITAHKSENGQGRIYVAFKSSTTHPIVQFSSRCPFPIHVCWRSVCAKRGFPVMK
jgi:hypothetical protein